MKDVIVGTAGHIDHGKSALVLALTGTDPDRLEEEKRRGITIDLGFAHLDLGDGVRVAFVDVPGHERFIKNMLAGATGIDLVILAVAADESIKPQTREHFDICKLLGVKQGLLAITKSDLVDRELLDIVRLEIQEFVAGSFLEGAPIVASSARTGEGLETLKSELKRLSLAVAPKPADLPFRLPIDRAFVMKGFGAVVTGTLTAGRVTNGAEVEILPIRKRVRVRGIQVHNQSADEALAGQRTALNLAGIDVKDLARGMVLAEPGLFEPTRLIDAGISLLPAARTVKNRARVHFHCGTAEMVANLIALDGKELKPGERAYVQLRLAEPGLFLPGDRFIIRQFSPLTTLGGGTLLDNHAVRHRIADPHVRTFLEVLERGEPKNRLELLARESRELPVPAAVARTGWAPQEVLRVAESLRASKRLVILGATPSVLVHTSQFEALSRAAVESVAQFHKSNPLAAGLAKEDLRGQLARAVTFERRGGDSGEKSPPVSPLLFDAVLEELAAAGKLEARAEMVRIPGQRVELTAEELAARDQMIRAFEAAGLAVPSSTEVLAQLKIDRARAEKILRILLNERTLVRVAENLIFHHTALEKLRQSLARRKSENSRIDVGAFKQMTGVTRKYAIPLLEYLDRERVTRRQGDERIIL